MKSSAWTSGRCSVLFSIWNGSSRTKVFWGLRERENSEIQISSVANNALARTGDVSFIVGARCWNYYWCLYITRTSILAFCVKTRTMSCRTIVTVRNMQMVFCLCMHGIVESSNCTYHALQITIDISDDIQWSQKAIKIHSSTWYFGKEAKLNATATPKGTMGPGADITIDELGDIQWSQKAIRIHSSTWYFGKEAKLNATATPKRTMGPGAEISHTYALPLKAGRGRRGGGQQQRKLMDTVGSIGAKSPSKATGGDGAHLSAIQKQGKTNLWKGFWWRLIYVYHIRDGRTCAKGTGNPYSMYREVAQLPAYFCS